MSPAKKDPNVIGGDAAPAGFVAMDTVEEMIGQAVDRALSARAPTPARVTPAGGQPLHPHSAGVGDTVAETWSYADQQAAQRGEHLEQLRNERLPDE